MKYKIPKRLKKIIAYGLVMPDGLMLGEIKRNKKEIKLERSRILKKVKLEIKVVKIY